jgi:prevent-host-death family protein
MYINAVALAETHDMNIGVAEIRNQMADALNRVAYQGERIVLERHGKGVAAIVSMEDLALLEELEDRRDLEEARKSLGEKGKNVPLAEVKRRLGLDSRPARGRRKP